MQILAMAEKGQTPHAPPGGTKLTVARTAAEFTKRLRALVPDLVVVQRVFAEQLQGLTKELSERAPKAPLVIVADFDNLKLDNLRRAFAADLAKASPRPPALKLAPLEFHSPKSGRADARLLAEFFQIPLAAVARIVGRSPQAVNKTPDARAIQGKLNVLVRIATSLKTAFGSPDEYRVWLSAPHEDLDNVAPLDLITEGKAEVVAHLLEDALLGHPG